MSSLSRKLTFKVGTAALAVQYLQIVSYIFSASKFPYETGTGNKAKLFEGGDGPGIFINKQRLEFYKTPWNRDPKDTIFLRDLLRYIFELKVSDIAVLVMAQRRWDKVFKEGSDYSFTDIVGEWFLDDLERKSKVVSLDYVQP